MDPLIDKVKRLRENKAVYAKKMTELDDQI
jgi:hypothetical protein